MPSGPLQNLVSAKQLKAEPPDRQEFENLVRSGRSRLVDACATARGLSLRESLHGLSMPAAYAWAEGERPARSLPRARAANAAEYGGEYDADERLLAEVIRVTKAVLAKLEQAGLPK